MGTDSETSDDGAYRSLIENEVETKKKKGKLRSAFGGLSKAVTKFLGAGNPLRGASSSSSGYELVSSDAPDDKFVVSETKPPKKLEEPTVDEAESLKKLLAATVAYDVAQMTLDAARRQYEAGKAEYDETKGDLSELEKERLKNNVNELENVAAKREPRVARRRDEMEALQKIVGKIIQGKPNLTNDDEWLDAYASIQKHEKGKLRKAKSAGNNASLPFEDKLLLPSDYYRVASTTVDNPSAKSPTASTLTSSSKGAMDGYGGSGRQDAMLIDMSEEPSQSDPVPREDKLAVETWISYAKKDVKGTKFVKGSKALIEGSLAERNILHVNSGENGNAYVVAPEFKDGVATVYYFSADMQREITGGKKFSRATKCKHVSGEKAMEMGESGKSLGGGGKGKGWGP